LIKRVYFCALFFQKQASRLNVCSYITGQSILIMSCLHDNLSVLDTYSSSGPFDYYQCNVCEKVFLCECDKERAIRLYPIGSRSTTEKGTSLRYTVDGFLPNICGFCKGVTENHTVMPLKTALESYYWNEITKTTDEYIVEDIQNNQIEIRDRRDFVRKLPEVYAKYYGLALIKWKQVHNLNPKYHFSYNVPEDQLANISIPTTELFLESKILSQSGKSYTKWVVENHEFESIEDALIHYYKHKGYSAWKNENNLITNLLDVFGQLAPHVKGSINLTLIEQTSKWEERKSIDKQTLLKKEVQHSTKEAYLQQEYEVENLLRVLDYSPDLLSLYNPLRLKRNKLIMERRKKSRIQHDPPYDDSNLADLTRNAIENIPKESLIKMIKWTIQNRRERVFGWPDLLVTNSQGYCFIEVKTPSDRLRPTQFEWFKWALDNEINCELCNIKTNKLRNGQRTLT
jgi:hypothetical protein